jgi:hypothetical protein
MRMRRPQIDSTLRCRRPSARRPFVDGGEEIAGARARSGDRGARVRDHVAANLDGVVDENDVPAFDGRSSLSGSSVELPAERRELRLDVFVRDSTLGRDTSNRRS